MDVKTAKVNSKVTLSASTLKKQSKFFKPVGPMFQVLDQDTEATILVGKDGRSFSVSHGTNVGRSMGR